MEKEPVGGSKAKVKQYVDQIKGGESKDAIMQGLSPSFIAGIEAGLHNYEHSFEPGMLKSEDDEGKDVPTVPVQYEGMDADTLDFIWTIPVYVNPEKNAQENERKQKVVDMLRKKESEDRKARGGELVDEVKIAEVRRNLGLGSEEDVAVKQQEIASLEREEVQEDHLLAGLVKYVSEGRKQAVVDLYTRLLDTVDNPESRKALALGLFQDIYNKYRIAEYPINPDEENTWERALKDTKVGVDNKKSEWMYRGVFPKNGEETVTRGSFNVNVTPELLDQLDDMIASGKMRANYKFGQPGTSASPTERHDSITIYFLDQPSDEALQELASTIKPHVRGDNLLGKKVEDGFFMSEIGSIESGHIESFVDTLRLNDPAFADAVRGYTSPQPGRGTSLKMSEAQYYAIKDVARAFGYTVSYDKDSGFELL